MNQRDFLNIMVKSFTQSAVGMLSITRQAELEHAKAVYGKLFTKPSKRLGLLLAADREVLVLFSAFDDQQVRTVQVAKQIIQSEDGRLESTVAIIVHRDSGGNAKLKKWGRDHGISVLPLYFDGTLPAGVDFERALCREMFSHDPFDVTGPVSDDTQFYGRRSEAQDLARQLQRGQIRTCLGIRKIGKTSILNRIISASRSNHDCCCVMTDCSKDEVWGMTASQMLDALAHAIANASETDERYVVLQESTTSANLSTCSKKLFKAVVSAEMPVLLFFDEIDYITPGSPTASHWRTDFNRFWRNFRAIYQEVAREGKALSLLISGVSSKWFTQESIDGVENAALHFIPEEYLNPLARGASGAMIKTIARTCGLQFDEENSDPIAEACSDIPFWIRKACSYIHRNTDIHARPLRIDRSTIMAHIERFIDVEGGTLAQVAIGHLFKVFPELEAAALKCLENEFAKVPKGMLKHLERYGVLVARHAEHKISGEMMRCGLRAHFDAKLDAIGAEETRGVSATNAGVPLAFESTDDWADELAVINRRRNLLEKKLREIALNFIRFDTLQSGNKVTVSERILKVVPDAKRSKLTQLPIEQAMGKLLWTELVQLMGREWKLFERIFGDKGAFVASCALINDRFDAHAKDADIADLALYRRALKTLEDAAGAI